jgi:2-keto-4-pentenoate hydratase
MAEAASVAWFAAVLFEATASATPIAPLHETHPGLSVADAYAIQRSWTAYRIERGADLVGRKVGLTSAAMQEMLGITEPDYGVLFEEMIVPSGATVDAADLIAPRVEPEIAFILGTALAGAHVTVEDVLASTEFIAPAIEIIDSRIVAWRIQLVDTIADNASSAMAVIGEKVPFERQDLAAIEAELTVGTETVAGRGDAVLGNPAEAVAWLARTLAGYGEALRAGDVVMPGAMTRALPVTAGDRAVARFVGLSDVEVAFA